MTTLIDQEKKNVVLDYFKRLDEGRPDVLDLFHEDAEIYFPKFGFGAGRQSLFDMFKGFEGEMEFIRHDPQAMSFYPSGDHLIVEGTTSGKISGKVWSGGETPGGRFCNVFTFRDDRIASVRIYLDPDYAGEDEARFKWGKDRRW